MAAAAAAAAAATTAAAVTGSRVGRRAGSEDELSLSLANGETVKMSELRRVFIL